jgi:hypothetical protein
VKPRQTACVAAPRWQRFATDSDRFEPAKCSSCCVPSRSRRPTPTPGQAYGSQVRRLSPARRLPDQRSAPRRFRVQDAGRIAAQVHGRAAGLRARCRSIPGSCRGGTPSQPPRSLPGDIGYSQKCRHFRRLAAKSPVSDEEFWRIRAEGRESRGESLLDEFSISEIWMRSRRPHVAGCSQ